MPLHELPDLCGELDSQGSGTTAPASATSNAGSGGTSSSGESEASASAGQKKTVNLYFLISAEYLRKAGYNGSMTIARSEAGRFLKEKIQSLGLDAAGLDAVNIEEENTWHFAFSAIFEYEEAQKLQERLIKQFKQWFGVDLGGNKLSVQNGSYLVVVRGTSFGLFEEFQKKEEGFREALQEEEDGGYKLPPGVNAMVGTRAQLDSLRFKIRCPKAVAQRLQAASAADTRNNNNNTIAGPSEAFRLVTADGAHVELPLDGHSTVGELKAKAAAVLGIEAGDQDWYVGDKELLLQEDDAFARDVIRAGSEVTLVVVQKPQPEVAEWVRRLRANDESLTGIESGDTEPEQMRYEDAQALAEALKVNNTLDYLCLRGCTGIGNAGWVALAGALKVNSTLVELDLSYCTGIGDAGATAFADALKVNSTLVELILSGCTGIGKAGWVALVDTIDNSRFTVRSRMPPCVGGTMMTYAARLHASSGLGYCRVYDPNLAAAAEAPVAVQAAVGDHASGDDVAPVAKKQKLTEAATAAAAEVATMGAAQAAVAK